VLVVYGTGDIGENCAPRLAGTPMEKLLDNALATQLVSDLRQTAVQEIGENGSISREMCCEEQKPVGSKLLE
jgi:hypothetical protein